MFHKRPSLTHIWWALCVQPGMNETMRFDNFSDELPNSLRR
ncbi:hypothetical protein BKP42_54670 [Rhodococcus erythropolis]|nr:hypothetical protein BKP42_54670 [Rhodococcus erythropolis]